MLEEIKQNQEDDGSKTGGYYEVGNKKPPKEYQFTSEKQPLPERKSRKGSPNRSTIAKLVLNMKVSPPEEILRGLRQMYPNFFNKKSKKWTNELLASLRQMQKAIIKGDTRALEIMLDSAYGKAPQDITTAGEKLPAGATILIQSDGEKPKTEEHPGS